MEIYAPEQHQLYDGRFIISGNRIHQVGTLRDESPWDHMGNDGSNLRPVEGTVEFDVDEINNTGTFRAELELPEGRYVIDLEEFKEFSPWMVASRPGCSSTAIPAAAMPIGPRAFSTWPAGVSAPPP